MSLIQSPRAWLRQALRLADPQLPTELSEYVQPVMSLADGALFHPDAFPWTKLGIGYAGNSLVSTLLVDGYNGQVGDDFFVVRYVGVSNTGTAALGTRLKLRLYDSATGAAAIVASVPDVAVGDGWTPIGAQEPGRLIIPRGMQLYLDSQAAIAALAGIQILEMHQKLPVGTPV